MEGAGRLDPANGSFPTRFPISSFRGNTCNCSAGSDLLHLSVSQKKLSHLHPADLADFIEDLSGRERSAIFHALDTETPTAEALEEIDPKIQKSLIETIPIEKASDIVEEMSPATAADLLGRSYRRTSGGNPGGDGEREG